MAKVKVVSRIKRWVEEHPLETVLLIGIILLGAFLRLYKIDQYMTFLGDEGRDVIIVRRLWVEHHPPLIGPGTSIGNMYLGPLYYYLMAIPLLLANYSPVGPAVMVALLGVVTIFLVWWVAREWFPVRNGQMSVAGLVAAFFYAISPTVIIYSRSSWNPNIMPFFALATIYLMWRVWKKKEYKLIILAGISFAFVLQSHYLGLLLLPVAAVLWLIAFFEARRVKKTSSMIRNTVLSAVLFFLLMSPLVIFDARHGWRNFSAMKQFFSARQETVSIKPWNAIPKIYPQFEKINIRLIGGRDENVGKVVSILFVISFLYILFIKREKFSERKIFVYLTLGLWLGAALVGLALYKQEIYDHYYGFVFALPFLIFGAICQFFLKNEIRKVVFILGFAGLFYFNLVQNPLRFSPNMQLKRAKDVASLIKEKAGGNRFNIATISERSNRDMYQYFLLIWGEKVVDTDPNATKYTVTNQLFVACEKPKEKCDPTHDSSTWIANFGWSKILDQWEVDGVTVFKLGHSK